MPGGARDKVARAREAACSFNRRATLRLRVMFINMLTFVNVAAISLLYSSLVGGALGWCRGLCGPARRWRSTQAVCGDDKKVFPPLSERTSQNVQTSRFRMMHHIFQGLLHHSLVRCDDAVLWPRWETKICEVHGNYPQRRAAAHQLVLIVVAIIRQ